MKPRILFVDDDSNILQGLRRSLRQQRGAWDMDFAEGGAAALATLQAQAADVVVTDMKMPGMNGAELLDEVSRLYPRSQRYILSGEADTEATFRTIATSHQFLQKPSDSARLVAIVTAGLHRRDALPKTEHQLWVTGTVCLPVSRGGAAHLASLLAEEPLALDRIGDVFAAEPALSAKVMQLANSAYFGVGDPVSDPKAAVALLGQDVLRALLREDNLLPAGPPPLCETFYERSIATARDVAGLAATIARQMGAAPAEAAQARLAGLLYALGRLLLCHRAPAAYADALAMARDGTPLEDAEAAVFGAPHGAFGAYLAQIWGLPAPVVEAICLADRPQDSPLSDATPLPLMAAQNAVTVVAGRPAPSAPPAAVAAAPGAQRSWRPQGLGAPLRGAAG